MSLQSIIINAQTAIVALLRGDDTLRTLLTGSTDPTWRIYDDVPDSTAFPYVQIGDQVQTPDDVFGSQGRSLSITLHVWSQYQGSKQTADIMSRIAVLLDRAELVVSGVTLQRCMLETEQIMRDPDGRTRHGIAVYRIEASEVLVDDV